MMSLANDSGSILIVGAGTTGLVAAIILQQAGIEVRVIERSVTPFTSARGTALMPRSLELLLFLGVTKSILEIATPPLEMAIYSSNGKTISKAFEWSEGAVESPEIPFRNVASISQARVNAILRSKFENAGGKIEMGTELVGVIQDEHKVIARLMCNTEGGVLEQSIEYSYLLAADGAKGRTRSFLDIPFLGETKQAERIFTADVHVPTGVSRQYWNRWGDFSTVAVALKPLYPEPLFQLQALGPELPKDRPDTVEGLQQFFHKVSGRPDIQFDSASDISEWRANIRLIERFSSGRVFFAGDAAHCHSPAGGQGNNSAIQDVFNLCWKLVKVLKHLALPSLLSTYEIERMPVIAEMLNLTNEMHSRVFNTVPSSAEAIQNAQKDSSSADPMFRSNKFLQLGVNYRWSPIVVDDRDNGLPTAEKNPYGALGSAIRAGDRAPDAPGLQIGFDTTTNTNTSTLSLFNLLADTSQAYKHTVIFIPATSSAISDVLNTIATLQKQPLCSVVLVFSSGTALPDSYRNLYIPVIDGKGHLCATYEVDRTRNTFVVLRPDGIIGAYVFTVGRVQHYFKVLCGAEV